MVYEYGSPTDIADNQAGRIRKVTDESGEEERYYGRLGEVVKEKRRINAFNNPVSRTWYETRYVFDSFGRMREMTYPDGEVLKYTYDSGGLLYHAEGTKRANRYVYVDKLRYDEFGQRTRIEYGNGVYTTYTYDDATRRLTKLYTVALDNKASRVIQNVDYAYDLVGNILYTDNTSVPFPPGGKRTLGTLFLYVLYSESESMAWPFCLKAYIETTSPRSSQDRLNAINYDEFGQRTSIEYGNKVLTTYTYDPLTRRLSHLKTTEPTKGRVIQDITYTYDLVGNILDIANKAPVPTGGEIGGTTEHHYTYDDLYQLTTANGYHLPAPGKRTTYTNNFAYDTIGNITSKIQRHLIIGTNSSQDPRDTNYILDYKYTGPQPHAVTDAGDKLYAYDKNGNMTGWTSKTTNAARVITWNEENRVKNIADSGNGTSFLYDDQGERVVKGGGGNESVYLNRFYSLKNGDLGSKHIFAGETRVCTKIEKDGGSLSSGIPGSIALVNSQGIYNALRHGNGQKRGINRRLPGATTGGTTTGANPPLEKFEFFYHGDHLGSSSFITDDAGAVYQHLEYFPYGETWVEEGGSGQMPMYRFTGKELDPETGLYYYGARYYDPVLSRWISADPIIGDYLPNLLIAKQRNKKSWKPNRDLPGLGGIYNSLNLGLYTYAHDNPAKYIDPSGKNVIGWIVTLTKTGFQKIAKLASKAAAVEARKEGKHVKAASKQMARQIEKANAGGKPILKHQGHDLPGNNKGMPHYQTPGKPGHTFWGGAMTVLFSDPLENIPFFGASEAGGEGDTVIPMQSADY